MPAVPWVFAATASPEPFGLDIEPGEQSFANPAELVAYVGKSLWPAFEAERSRLRLIDLWYKGDQANPNVPRGATSELRNLLALSRTPWLGLVVTTIAQTMYGDGYRSPDAKGNSSPWRTWNANSFDVRQIAVHRAALAYGYSYTIVLPGVSPDGVKTSVLRGVSPQRMFAVYEDPAADDWPIYAMKVEPERGGVLDLKVFDDTYVHYLTRTNDGVKWLKSEGHSAGVCPVVRYCNQLDLDGRTPGEVEPFIPVASRIDKTEFDRLTVQHFNSWKVRTISGMANFAETDQEANLKKLKLRQEDFLVSEDPDTKFGTLDETNLTGFIAAAEADIEALAAVAQLPNHLLTGKMVNLSAEALAAARAPLTQKVYERQVAFGAAHSQMLRLSAKLEGDLDAANDVMARITWQDVEVRSLSQAVDALGKAAQMLGIPRQYLWARIPGVTQADVEEWADHALDDDPLSKYLRSQSDIRATPAGADLVAKDQELGVAAPEIPAAP
ncbi:phage portal protein [Nocardia sp. NBC_00511]|uniref:phage portal protein n=1 Tax=Nocardia sp. NBC_00511 TaxID=2903591 RepID=UPI0030E06A64